MLTILRNKTAKIILKKKQKLGSVSLFCKILCFRTANIKILYLNSTPKTKTVEVAYQCYITSIKFTSITFMLAQETRPVTVKMGRIFHGGQNLT